MTSLEDIAILVVNELEGCGEEKVVPKSPSEIKSKYLSERDQLLRKAKRHLNHRKVLEKEKRKNQI